MEAKEYAWNAMVQNLPLFLSPPSNLLEGSSRDLRQSKNNMSIASGGSFANVAPDDDDDIEIFQPEGGVKGDHKEKGDKIPKMKNIERGSAQSSTQIIKSNITFADDPAAFDDDDSDIVIFQPGKTNSTKNSRFELGQSMENNVSKISGDLVGNTSEEAIETPKDTAFNGGDDDDDDDIAIFNPADSSVNNSSKSRRREGLSNDNDDLGSAHTDISGEIYELEQHGDGSSIDSTGEIMEMDPDAIESMYDVSYGGVGGGEDSKDSKEDQASGRRHAFVSQADVLACAKSIKENIQQIDDYLHKVFNLQPVCRTYLHWRSYLQELEEIAIGLGEAQSKWSEILINLIREKSAQTRSGNSVKRKRVISGFSHVSLDDDAHPAKAELANLERMLYANLRICVSKSDASDDPNLHNEDNEAGLFWWRFFGVRTREEKLEVFCRALSLYLRHEFNQFIGSDETLIQLVKQTVDTGVDTGSDHKKDEGKSHDNIVSDNEFREFISRYGPLKSCFNKMRGVCVVKDTKTGRIEGKQGRASREWVARLGWRHKNMAFVFSYMNHKDTAHTPVTHGYKQEKENHLYECELQSIKVSGVTMRHLILNICGNQRFKYEKSKILTMMGERTPIFGENMRLEKKKAEEEDRKWNNWLSSLKKAHQQRRKVHAIAEGFEEVFELNTFFEKLRSRGKSPLLRESMLETVEGRSLFKWMQMTCNNINISVKDLYSSSPSTRHKALVTLQHLTMSAGASCSTLSDNDRHLLQKLNPFSREVSSREKEQRQLMERKGNLKHYQWAFNDYKREGQTVIHELVDAATVLLGTTKNGGGPINAQAMLIDHFQNVLGLLKSLSIVGVAMHITNDAGATPIERVVSWFANHREKSKSSLPIISVQMFHSLFFTVYERTISDFQSVVPLAGETHARKHSGILIKVLRGIIPQGDIEIIEHLVKTDRRLRHMLRFETKRETNIFLSLSINHDSSHGSPGLGEGAISMGHGNDVQSSGAAGVSFLHYLIQQTANHNHMDTHFDAYGNAPRIAKLVFSEMPPERKGLYCSLPGGEHGDTPILAAARANHQPMMKFLLHVGTRLRRDFMEFRRHNDAAIKDGGGGGKKNSSPHGGGGGGGGGGGVLGALGIGSPGRMSSGGKSPESMLQRNSSQLSLKMIRSMSLVFQKNDHDIIGTPICEMADRYGNCLLHFLAASSKISLREVSTILSALDSAGEATAAMVDRMNAKGETPLSILLSRYKAIQSTASNSQTMQMSNVQSIELANVTLLLLARGARTQGLRHDEMEILGEIAGLAMQRGMNSQKALNLTRSPFFEGISDHTLIHVATSSPHSNAKIVEMLFRQDQVIADRKFRGRLKELVVTPDDLNRQLQAVNAGAFHAKKSSSRKDKSTLTHIMLGNHHHYHQPSRIQSSQMDERNLLRLGLNLADDGEKNPLHYIASKQNTQTRNIAKLLVENSVNIVHMDAEGLTPLHVAAKANQLEIVDLMVSTHMHLDIKTGRVQDDYALYANAMKQLEGSSSRVNAKHDRTALFFAVEQGNWQICSLLLARKAQVDEFDSQGKTALTVAFQCRHGRLTDDKLYVDIVETLEVWRELVGDVQRLTMHQKRTMVKKCEYWLRIKQRNEREFSVADPLDKSRHIIATIQQAVLHVRAIDENLHYDNEERGGGDAAAEVIGSTNVTSPADDTTTTATTRVTKPLGSRPVDAAAAAAAAAERDQKYSNNNNNKKKNIGGGRADVGSSGGLKLPTSPKRANKMRQQQQQQHIHSRTGATAVLGSSMRGFEDNDQFMEDLYETLLEAENAITAEKSRIQPIKANLKVTIDVLLNHGADIVLAFRLVTMDVSNCIDIDGEFEAINSKFKAIEKEAAESYKLINDADISTLARTYTNLQKGHRGFTQRANNRNNTNANNDPDTMSPLEWNHSQRSPLIREEPNSPQLGTTTHAGEVKLIERLMKNKQHQEDVDAVVTAIQERREAVFRTKYNQIVITEKYKATIEKAKWAVSTLVEDEFSEQISILKRNFLEIDSVDEFYMWAKGPFLDVFYPEQRDQYYDGNTLKDRTPTYLGQGRVVGLPRWRQQRWDIVDCELYPSYKELGDVCTKEIDRWPWIPVMEHHGSTEMFGNNWLYEDPPGPFSYSWASGTSRWYPGGGFSQDFPDVTNTTMVYEESTNSMVSAARVAAAALVTELMNKTWIDSMTRVVFVEFNVYNANEDLWLIGRMNVEFPNTGGIKSSASLEVLTEISWPFKPESIHIWVLKFVVLVFALWNFVQWCVNACFLNVGVRRSRNLNIDSFYNAVGMFINALWALVILSQIGMILATNSIDFATQNSFIDMTEISFLSQGYTNFFSMLLFLLWVKLTDHWSVQREISRLVVMIMVLLHELQYLLLFMLIMWIAFATGIFVAYGYRNNQHSLWITSLLTTISNAFNGEDLLDQRDQSPFMGTIYGVAALILVLLVLMNLVIAILTAAYENAREEVGDAFWAGHQYRLIQQYTKTMTSTSKDKNHQLQQVKVVQLIGLVISSMWSTCCGCCQPTDTFMNSDDDDSPGEENDDERGEIDFAKKRRRK
eukprot:jgi/Bigna1/80520/fgenesh1_pg.71_\